MSQKSSTFVRETRKRETWLAPTVERAGVDPKESEALLAAAALLRGTLEAIPVPEEAEERSRAAGVAYMQELRDRRIRPTETRAPWYLRLGHLMRFVFTLGRRR